MRQGSQVTSNGIRMAYIYARDDLAAKGWHGKLTSAKARAIATAIAERLSRA